MESYTYLFLFVLQLVFTVVVLLALLHEKRLQKQLEKKNKQLLTELLNLRGEIQAMRSTDKRRSDWQGMGKNLSI